MPHKRQWTRERVAEAIRRWEAQTGRPPTVSDWTPTRASADSRERFAAGGWPHAHTVRDVYGTFSRAVRAAGCKPGRLPYRRIKRARTREWTRDELLSKLQAWAVEYETPPTVADWNPSLARRRRQHDRVKRYYAGEWPPSTTVARVFGGWQLALRAAGLAVRQAGGTND